MSGSMFLLHASLLSGWFFFVYYPRTMLYYLFLSLLHYLRNKRALFVFPRHKRTSPTFCSFDYRLGNTVNLAYGFSLVEPNPVVANRVHVRPFKTELLGLHAGLGSVRSQKNKVSVSACWHFSSRKIIWRVGANCFPLSSHSNWRFVEQTPVQATLLRHLNCFPDI